MGLDTTHDCWHGAYSAFNRWRCKLAEVADIPLLLMEGYYQEPNPEALEWLAPREGGPRCGSYLGPSLHYWLENVTEWLPISWDALKPDPLLVLLDHSDCDGRILAADCGPLADRLEELMPLLPDEEDPGHIGVWRAKTQQFIDGLRLAASRGEDMGFH